MNKLMTIAFAALMIFALPSCKKDKVEEADEIDLLAARLPGEWNLETVSYSGVAPSPIDPTIQFPFSGEGEQVSGQFVFTEDSLFFEMHWVARLSLGQQKITIPVDEVGTSTWQVIKSTRTVEGIANDTVPAIWNVIENTADYQVWRTKTVRDYPDFDDPILLDIETKFVKVN